MADISRFADDLGPARIIQGRNHYGGAMYRIRLHGRGGQGIKTAGRILGTAFFLEGFEVQDAPRYGAERRARPCLPMSAPPMG